MPSFRCHRCPRDQQSPAGRRRLHAMPLTGASASGEIVGLWLNPTAVASTLGAPMRTILCAVWTVVLLAGADDPGRAGRLVLVAGGGTGGDGSPADQARLAGPFGVWVETQ